MKKLFSLGGGSNNNNKSGNGQGGIWSWNNNGIWQDFDLQASKQVDEQLRNQWQNGTATILTFPLTKGPWFSQSRNRGVYFINVSLNTSRTKIKNVMQQNTKTGFARQMKRTPPFLLHPHQNNNNNNNNNNGNNNKNNNKNKMSHNNNNKVFYANGNNNNSATTTTFITSSGGGMTNINNLHNIMNMYANNNQFGGGGGISFSGHGGGGGGFGTMLNGPITKGDGSICWSWKDDTQWREYDDTTSKQIETAYNSNKNSVVLNQGPFFGASHRRGQYQIVFNKNSMPPSFHQVNTSTHFQRKVERTGRQNINGNNNNDNNGASNKNNNNNDKHFKWRQYYRPMTVKHYNV